MELSLVFCDCSELGEMVANGLMTQEPTAHLVDRVVHDPRVRLLPVPHVVVARRQHQVEVVNVRQPRDARLEVPARDDAWPLGSVADPASWLDGGMVSH